MHVFVQIHTKINTLPKLLLPLDKYFFHIRYNRTRVLGNLGII